MKKLNELDERFNNEEVKKYYDVLSKKTFYRFVKRLFDIVASFILIIILAFPSCIIGLAIIFSSKGGVFYLQNRVGRYGKTFKIIKFRTMVKGADKSGELTTYKDSRITKVGRVLRKTHIDEFPQLFNVFVGQMSFVGTRPEVKRYVDEYKNEWFATLLMAPGITSRASYSSSEEGKKLVNVDIDKEYMNVVLPIKMKMNLEDLTKCSFIYDIKTMFKTVF